MIISFFLLDMFIGVMVETFHQCQQNQKSSDGELLEEGGKVQCNSKENEGACWRSIFLSIAFHSLTNKRERLVRSSKQWLIILAREMHVFGLVSTSGFNRGKNSCLLQLDVTLMR